MNDKKIDGLLYWAKMMNCDSNYIMYEVNHKYFC